ncbi:MAG: 34-kDa subunit of RNA polymerase III (C) [Pycnora praestabilis]|nr:MAG: 34-kDa subunit of RNA polymerase III (C) [Pycnora praestabilis]
MAFSSDGAGGDASTKELTNALYARCAQGATDQLFYQADLLDMGVIPESDLNVFLTCVQQLVRTGLFKVFQHDGAMAWKVVKKEDADRYKSFTADEALIYSYIESSSREGIWTKTLKMRANIHQSILTRCLKSLETRNFIKTIKSVKYPARKIYMLSSLTPSEDQTGGPWFTDGELDTDFIEVLSKYVTHFISRRSWARATSSMGAVKKATMSKAEAEVARAKALEGKKQQNKIIGELLPLPPGYRKYPTLTEITENLNKSGVTQERLVEVDVRQLLDVLCYDGKVEKVMGTGYKAVLQPEGEDEVGPRNGLTESPCGRCPVFNLCEEGGPVSASNCEYFKIWLDIL